MIQDESFFDVLRFGCICDRLIDPMNFISVGFSSSVSSQVSISMRKHKVIPNMHCQNCLILASDNFNRNSNSSSRHNDNCRINCCDNNNDQSQDNLSRCQFNNHVDNENVDKYSQTCSKQKFLSSKRFSYKESGWNFCLLIFILGTLVLPSSIMTTPLPKSSSSVGGSGSFDHHRHHKDHNNRLHERPAKFINPCRLPATPPALQTDSDIQSQPDIDIFHNIITQSTKALRQAQEFVDDFYKESFGTDLKSESRFEDVSYDFLADATQKMSQFNNDQLSTLNVEEQIRFLYQSLQKFAVGLEAIVLDQACYGGGFYHHFNEAEYQLKYVLCELQIAMLEKNIEYTDITRDIMSQEHRDIENKSIRDIRDFVIFRDYIKALTYVNTTFQFFHDRALEQQL